MVNGQKVKLLQMSAEAQSVKFVYLGYFASNNSGTLQFVCFTTGNLLKIIRLISKISSMV